MYFYMFKSTRCHNNRVGIYAIIIFFLCLLSTFFTCGTAVQHFQRLSQSRNAFGSEVRVRPEEAISANSNQVSGTSDKSGSEAVTCSKYTTQGALLNHLRMRASFNPTLMSNSLEEAETKVRQLLGENKYETTAQQLGRYFPANRQVRGEEYFSRANALASYELMKNNELSLRKICWGRPVATVTGNVTATVPTFNRRVGRSLEDAVKTADLDLIGVTRRQFCLNRGDDKNGLLRLCSMCAAVTELPESYFPRFINEVTCSSEDTGCIYAGSLPHGICQSKKLEITVLERYTNHECLEDWQPVNIEIRVSCECFVHRSSFLRPFV